MSLAWATDFTYGYFRRILQAAKSNFELFLLFEAPQILNEIGKPKLILRHDVDVDLNRALRMAEIEKEFDISATYMVMVNSPLYRVEQSSSKAILRKIISMNHEIGLHFDFDNNTERISNPKIGSFESKIHVACKGLEDLISQPIRSISFHRPLQQFLEGPLIIDGKVNAYSRELMTWYLSDSKGNWREGEPLPKLLNPDRPVLQLLIHPIWWGDEHISPEERLQAFFEDATQGFSPERIKTFEVALADHLGIRWRGRARLRGN